MSEQQKQLTFLSQEPENIDPVECQTEEQSVLKVYIDGAARNNPGPSGSGICLMRGKKILFEQGFFVGTRTNNQAEYLGLLIASYFVKEYAKNHEKILIYSDSQLLVRQMSGVYKVRDPFLKKMQLVAYELLQLYHVTFCHIYREHNTRADLMANRGIDKSIPLPKKFVDLMQHYEINIF